MIEVVFGADAKSAPSWHDPIRALLRAGRNDEAIVRLCAINITQPDDLVAKELLFDAFFSEARLGTCARTRGRSRPPPAGRRTPAEGFDRNAFEHEAL